MGATVGLHCHEAECPAMTRAVTAPGRCLVEPEFSARRAGPATAKCTEARHARLVPPPRPSRPRAGMRRALTLGTARSLRRIEPRLRDRKSIRSDPVLHVLPRHRPGDRKTRPGAGGPGSDRRGAAAVAQVVEEDAALPLLRIGAQRVALRIGPGDALNDSARKNAALIGTAPALHRHHQMQPLPARRLGPGGEAFGQQQVPELQGGVGHEVPRQPFAGIEIEHQGVRMLDVVDGGAPWVHFHDAHIHEPEEPATSRPRGASPLRPRASGS
jgi:hypothetical protein